ncbi:TetR/AcrR family transcriptional regulator [Variovorax sp. NFACC27]|uniref:TetR family transcriptional regulator n=1 Tax=Variovorax gossypii TaxID=1679495 RepID=A0A3S0H153_9BURK|nr:MULTISPECIES: TetR/AcrR family transcriptional regulator [Variovorax]SEF30177.1 transcriptional regulator, TetR family [Variovorax sp. NFACC28]SEG83951.1 transcriptional regulator, TetR family [Variovorax sp. NFACC29]SFD15921.1 transcriptional regulator, TetR family [Variovorax sp. NFACC26]SFG23791.1 transcriptional regulator, TetR family [Variovorax sp. NFACC27]RTQ37390.1 TetR family transcriptional regulator [Variovorax gossypii]
MKASKDSTPDISIEAIEPRSRDADRSQLAILASARDEFSARGLAGARMDSIAERAGLNKRLIYYYFGSKDDLFLAVLERVYADIREAEQRLHLEEIDPVEAIRQLVSFTWNYYLEHPEFITLLNSENLHCAAHLKRSERIQEMNSPLVQLLDTVLERGRRDDLFRAGVDPVQLYISIASLCYFYLSNNHTLSAIFGRDLRAPKAMAQRLSHMTDLVLGYVLK